MKKYNKFGAVLLLILFADYSLTLAQSTAQVKEAKLIKKQVESGQLSPAEALKKAQEAGATSEQIQMAQENLQQLLA